MLFCKRVSAIATGDRAPWGERVTTPSGLSQALLLRGQTCSLWLTSTHMQTVESGLVAYFLSAIHMQLPVECSTDFSTKEASSKDKNHLHLIVPKKPLSLCVCGLCSAVVNVCTYVYVCVACAVHMCIYVCVMHVYNMYICIHVLMCFMCTWVYMSVFSHVDMYLCLHMCVQG